MSYRKVFWGVLLILIGSLFILKNLGLIYFDWGMILSLWPLLLILWGISILPVNSVAKLLISFASVIIALLVVNRYDDMNRGWHFWDRDFKFQYKGDRDWDKDEYNTYQWEDGQKLTAEYENKKFASMDFDAGAGKFIIKEASEDHLATFVRKGKGGKYSMKTRTGDDKQYIEFQLKTRNIEREDNFENTVNAILHPEPLWDFDFDVGAAKIDFDLTPFKVQKVDIDGGASSIDLRLGDRYDKTAVYIDAGASELDISIPESSGCRLKKSTFLTGTSLSGFTKQDDGSYITENYETAKNKIEVKFQAAISDISIRRY